jgi:hypothetical protein
MYVYITLIYFEVVFVIFNYLCALILIWNSVLNVYYCILIILDRLSKWVALLLHKADLLIFDCSYICWDELLYMDILEYYYILNWS